MANKLDHLDYTPFHHRKDLPNFIENCGVFLVNKNAEILLLHQRGASMRSWTVPLSQRIGRDRLIKTAYNGLFIQTCVKKPFSNFTYLGTSKRYNRRELFHSFILKMDKIPTIYLDDKKFDMYRWIKINRIDKLVCQPQRDQLQILQDHLVKLNGSHE